MATSDRLGATSVETFSSRLVIGGWGRGHLKGGRGHRGQWGAPGDGGRGHLAGNLGAGGFPSEKLRTPGHPSKAVKAGGVCVEGSPRRGRW